MGDNPYARLPEWLLHSQVSDRAVRLYAVLQRYMGKNKVAWPSKATLAEHLACSERAIERATDELVRVGAVAITSPIGAPNRYRVFLVPTFQDRPPTRKPPTPVSEVDHQTCDTTVGGQPEPATPVSEDLRHPCRRTCDTGVAQKELQEPEPRSRWYARNQSSSTHVGGQHHDDDPERVNLGLKFADEVARLYAEAKLDHVRDQKRQRREPYTIDDPERWLQKTAAGWLAKGATRQLIVTNYVTDPDITAEQLVHALEPDLFRVPLRDPDLAGHG